MAKMNDVAERIERIEGGLFAVGSNIVEDGVDPLLVSTAIYGVMNGMECVRQLVSGELDCSDIVAANALLSSTLTAAAIQMDAIRMADTGEEVEELMLKMVEDFISGNGD
jgi:hypothetical protein